jgi:mannosyltransferase
MRNITLPKATAITGGALLLIALMLPAPALIAFLRGDAAVSDAQLLLGGLWFKISLAVLGAAAIAMGRLHIWDSVPPIKTSSKPRSRLTLTILAAILITATALRLYELNAGLWLDEILTNVLYAKLPFGTIITTFDSENQHFLYSLMAHASFQIFGESVWALRLPAVLFGVGSICAIYLFGSEVASQREGLLAAALLTFSYQHVWFSQNARGYTGLLFWTILSSWLFLRAMRETRPGLWLLYAASAALGAYTHITMLFVVAGQFLIYLIALLVRRKRPWTNRWGGLFLGFGLAGPLTLQCYALVVPQILGGLGGETSLVEEWKDPLWTALEFVKGIELSFAGGLTALAALVALAAMVVFGVGLVGYLRKAPEVVGLVMIPPVLTAAVVIGLGHHLWPRFFFLAYGFAALVAVRGAVALGETAARMVHFPSSRASWVGTAACIAVIAASGLSLRFVYGPKQDYSGALNFVETQKRPGDAIVTAGLSTFVYDDYYKVNWPAVTTLDELNAIRAQAKRTWLVYTFSPVLESTSPEIMTSLQREFTVVKQFDGTVDDGAVIVARANGSSPTLTSNRAK